MHDSFDFSQIERIEPRMDSWERVCIRLNRQEDISRKILPFRLYALLPLAASFVLVGLSVLLTPMQTIDKQSKVIQESTHQDIATWYNDLGTNFTDNYEDLDVFASLDFSSKENK